MMFVNQDAPGRSHKNREPLAIIGIGCRYPGGANSPEGFWRLLRDGVDAITEVPPDRWLLQVYYDPDPDKSGTIRSRWGGFVEQIDLFDADFFGISPREAAVMDPQQRLLLEVAWEALEDPACRRSAWPARPPACSSASRLTTMATSRPSRASARRRTLTSPWAPP
jgi:acyl transferase domain-containing protein